MYRANAPQQPANETVIGNDAWIGHGAFVMQGVSIGDGAAIEACPVVTKDVPPYAAVAGSPAVVRKLRFSELVIARMQRLAWWRYAFWELAAAPVADPTKFLDVVEARIQVGLQEYAPRNLHCRALASQAWVRLTTASGKARAWTDQIPAMPARRIIPGPCSLRCDR